MKVVIPLAGLGKRMRPHTHSKAKPMVRLAGRPILGHLLDWVAGGDHVDEVILIISPHQTDVEAYARSATKKPVRIVVQDHPRGQADAIARTAPYVDEPLLIVFSDTLADVTFEHLADVDVDGLIYVKEIADPSRMGIIQVEDGRIVDMIEKPQQPVSNLATIGMYYFRDHAGLFSAIDRVLAAPPRLQGEYFLADAISLAVEHGARLKVLPVSVWEDTGTIDAILHANRYLLRKQQAAGPEAPYVQGTALIVPPSFVAPDARLEHSVVGPYASIGAGSVITDSVVRNSIVGDQARVRAAVLSGALVGDRAVVEGGFQKLNIGDDSSLLLDTSGEIDETFK